MIVADESVDFRIVRSLRSNGFDVFSIVQNSPSVSDLTVLEIAVNKKAILITEDKDFGEITFRLKKTHCGILLLKLNDLDIIEKIKIVNSIVSLRQNDLLGNFTVVDRNKVRVIKNKS